MPKICDLLAGQRPDAVAGHFHRWFEASKFVFERPPHPICKELHESETAVPGDPMKTFRRCCVRLDVQRASAGGLEVVRVRKLADWSVLRMNLLLHPICSRFLSQYACCKLPTFRKASVSEVGRCDAANQPYPKHRP